MSATFRRVTIAVQIREGRQNREAYHLHDSSWAVLKIEHARRKGSAWAVYHVPTGLAVRQGIKSLKAAKDLAVTLRDAHPSLPALDAQPFGVAPRGDAPEKIEALAILATINAWARDQAEVGR